MNRVFKSIAEHAVKKPEIIALHSGPRKISYAELNDEIKRTATFFIENNIRVLGLYLDNCIEWVLADLAAQYAGITLVPLPLFFSGEQIKFIFTKTRIDSVISFDNEIITEIFNADSISELAPGINLYRCKSRHESYNSLKNTGKITFTSGTTGQPKGVCLTNESLMDVASSLLNVTSSLDIESHLCLLPLSTLLENIAGIYSPLLKGVTCQLPSIRDTGLRGATELDVSRMIDCVNYYKPNSVIFFPQMLNDLVNEAESGVQITDALKFVATGGGVIPPSLIKRARKMKLPVYEGYGLSECASVVSLNVPGNESIGSTGKIFNNIEIRIADDNEVLLKGNFMQGYLAGDPLHRNDWIATGDVGNLDKDGFLHITGRKKNIFITSFGRNVSPEWTESEITGLPGIKNAVVFGESKPANCAVIVTANNNIPDSLVETAIDKANKNLPDYARIHYWIRAKENFSSENGLCTTNGRPVRDKIYSIYRAEIENCYKKTSLLWSA